MAETHQAVFVVVRPWDYTSAEVMGVFDTRVKAVEFVKNSKVDDSGTRIETLVITEMYVE